MQIPASPADLTVPWLTSILRPHGLALNSVQSCVAELLGGEQGMTGQLARLRIQYQDDQPELPSTLIAKFSASEPAARTLISALGHYEREVRFYELLSSRTPVSTPYCYNSSHDSETGFTLLVLEDLARARNGNSVAGCSVDEVTQVLATLARLHATWWQSVDLVDASWLRLRFLLAPEAMVGAFAQGWPAFVEKLSIPVTGQIT